MSLRTAIILPGCPAAPEALVAGLPRRERLRKTLEAKGFHIVSNPDEAHLKLPDCRIFVGDELLHLCEEGLARVEKRLLTSLRKPMELDGIVCYLLTRHVSLAITRLLMNRRVTPNQITLVTFIVGISSGVVVAFGGYWAGLLGAILLQTQAVLDCVDGELARLRFQSSRLGQWLDTISDDLATLSFLAGVTWTAAQSPILVWTGITGIAALISERVIIYFALATVYHTGDLLMFRWHATESSRSPLAWLKFLAKNDFYCLAFLSFAILGRLDIVLVVSAIGAVSVLTALLLQIRRHGLR